MATVPGRHAPAIAAVAANGISQLGNRLTVIALPWFVLQLTASPAQVGLVVAAGALPAIVTGVFGGALVDRLGWRRSWILSDMGSGLAVALVPLLYHTVGLAVWHLLGIAFLKGLLETPGGMARRALLPDLAALAGIALVRLNAGNHAVQRGALLLGSLLAGVLITTLGASGVLWVDALTFATAAALVTFFVPTGATTTVPSPSGTYLAQLGDGWRLLGQHPLLRSVLVASAVLALLREPLAVVLPVYAQQTLGGALDLGLLVSSLAIGTLTGAVLFTGIGPHLPRRATVIGALMVAGLLYGVLAMRPPVVGSVLALTVLGLAFAPLDPLLITALQEQMPAAVRGRVFGVQVALTTACVALSTAVVGVLVAELGLRLTLVIIAVGFLAFSVVMLRDRAFAQLEATHPGVEAQ